MQLHLEGMERNAQKASALLKAMANERRLMVLCHILQGEKSVGELEQLVGLSQSALSQHLARLRRDGLVQTRRSAQTIFYSLRGKDAEEIIMTLQELFVAPSTDGKRAAAKGGLPAMTAYT